MKMGRTKEKKPIRKVLEGKEKKSKYELYNLIIWNLFK